MICIVWIYRIDELSRARACGVCARACVRGVCVCVSCVLFVWLVFVIRWRNRYYHPRGAVRSAAGRHSETDRGKRERTGRKTKTTQKVKRMSGRSQRDCAPPPLSLSLSDLFASVYECLSICRYIDSLHLSCVCRIRIRILPLFIRLTHRQFIDRLFDRVAHQKLEYLSLASLTTEREEKKEKHGERRGETTRWVVSGEDKEGWRLGVACASHVTLLSYECLLILTFYALY